MSDAHALVGHVAIVLGLIAAVGSLLLVATRRTPGTMYLGWMVWVLSSIALAAALGVGVIASGHPPRDGLHIVYGVLALVILPGTALIASGREGRQRAIIAAIGTIVLAILLARLLQTGS